MKSHAFLKQTFCVGHIEKRGEIKTTFQYIYKKSRKRTHWPSSMGGNIEWFEGGSVIFSVLQRPHPEWFHPPGVAYRWCAQHFGDCLQATTQFLIFEARLTLMIVLSIWPKKNIKYIDTILNKYRGGKNSVREN